MEDESAIAAFLCFLCFFFAGAAVESAGAAIVVESAIAFLCFLCFLTGAAAVVVSEDIASAAKTVVDKMPTEITAAASLLMRVIMNPFPFPGDKVLRTAGKGIKIAVFVWSCQ